MLLDASVARSVAILGWATPLAHALGGSLKVAHGILGADPRERCELQRIRDALQREATASPAGSGRYSKALAAVHSVNMFMTLGAPTITVMYPDADEIQMTARLTSRAADQREWRRGLGLRARRLDSGEAVSIAIAHARGLEFASDDEQALIAYTALTRRPAIRTLDVILLLVDKGLIEETQGRIGYRLLREDDLHLLGGPDW